MINWPKEALVAINEEKKPFLFSLALFWTILIRIDKLQIPEPREIKTPKFNKKKSGLLIDKGVKIKPNNKISKPKIRTFFSPYFLVISEATRWIIPQSNCPIAREKLIKPIPIWLSLLIWKINRPCDCLIPNEINEIAQQEKIRNFI